MKVAIATGIFPPDIGGPATHANDLVAELRDRGHDVSVLTLTDGDREAGDTVVRYPRSWPWPLRASALVSWLVRNRSRYDVVYATGIGPMAVAGARLARRPVVLKLVGDPAWERGARHGLTSIGFDDFQCSRVGSPRLRGMQAVRNWSVRRATAVIAPSEYLKDVVERWVGGAVDVMVVPNGVRAPAAPSSPPNGSGPRAVRAAVVGRLVAHKHVDLLLDAVARTDLVTLDVLGDGPELDALRATAEGLAIADRVAFHGATAHEVVMQRLSEADVLLSSSGYEGLPHVVIESLVCATPVFTAGAGGSTEAVRHGTDGLVLEPTPKAFATALARLRDDPSLRRHLSEGARRSGDAWRFDRTADHIESILERVVASRPRAVFLGRTRVTESPTDTQRQKFALHDRFLRQISINVGPTGVRRIGGTRVLTLPDRRPRPLTSALFYSVGPMLALALTLGRRRSAIICQSPFEAMGIVVATRPLPHRWRPRLQVEVHGDWRSAPRTYGGRLRRIVAPLADRACAWTLRRADLVRVVGDATTALVRQAGYTGPIEHYIAFSDYRAFTEVATVDLPDRPRVTFVGMLERSKAVDVLLDAWPSVLARCPDATLTIVGEGSQRGALQMQARRHDIEGSVSFTAPVPQAALRSLFDDSTCLVLPSRSEGLGRVIVEVMARARPVVAVAVGGIPELVEDGVTGRLVATHDPAALAGALSDVLTHPDRARAMGDEARRRVLLRDPQAEYETGITRLTNWIARRDTTPAGRG